MNRALLNPFLQSDIPRTIQDTLEDERATCMRFNRHGNILAVGTVSGRVILWNFDTRTIATTLAGDMSLESDPRARQIVSLTFPAPGNASAVIVAYANGILRFYHTLTGLLLSELLFDVALHQVEAHPKIDSIVSVVPVGSLPLLIHIHRGRYRFVGETFKSVKDPAIVLLAPALESPPEMRSEPALPPKTTYGNKRISNLQPHADSIPHSVLCATDEFNNDGVSSELFGARRRSNFSIAFTRTKQHLLRGGPTGVIRVFKLTLAEGNRFVTGKCICTVSIQGRSAIRSITLSRRERVLVNSQDRCMRMYKLADIERTNATHEDVVMVAGTIPHPVIEADATFTEIVNRSLCRSACFSHDGDFVIGGMEGAQHRLHVWRVQDAQLHFTLEGPKEGILDLLMHPLRSVMVSLGTQSGSVYIWAKEVSENWSAFSTQFSELEANEEYVEKEDEFDINHKDTAVETMNEERERNEAQDVDIVGSYSAWFPSDSDTEDSFFYVPVTPMPDADSSKPLLSESLFKRRKEQLKALDEKRESAGNGVSSQANGCDEGTKKRGIRRSHGQEHKSRSGKGNAKRSKGGMVDSPSSSGMANGNVDSDEDMPFEDRDEKIALSAHAEGRRRRGRRAAAEVGEERSIESVSQDGNQSRKSSSNG